MYRGRALDRWGAERNVASLTAKGFEEGAVRLPKNFPNFLCVKIVS